MRKRKSGLERLILAGLGLAALMTTCAALAAGWFVAGDLSAGVQAAHLPTPAVSYAAPGAVVQWRWQTPAASPRVRGGEKISGWMEVSGGDPLSEPSGPPQDERVEAPVVASTPQAAQAGAPEIRRPVAGQVSQAYGCSPYYSGIPGPGCPVEAFWFHDGVDIAVGVGTPVQAGMAGRVTFAAADGDGPLCNQGYRGYGLAVMVDNGEGWQALYAHLSGIDVQEGQAVEPETVIGLSGDTGCVSGAHLHFGLRHDGELVDPLEVMQ
jgi:murein DD-endopeptidase MepM/ murein hydrolase activator NlpD